MPPAILPDVHTNQPHRIALTAFALGGVTGLFLGLIRTVQLKAFSVYMASLALFHFLEYYTTAKYNPKQVSEDSFLLNNGIEYLLCHSIAILECFLEYVFLPRWKTDCKSTSHLVVISLGYFFMIMGQMARTLAMCTAGGSFSHTVKTNRGEDHILIKQGIYKWIRHPSYFGFFWWAIGTQMILLNPISLVLFATVLWKFFRQRIKFEESYLLQFFGREYYEYRESVPALIPFIE
ncbi:STE14 (YDR410C) [Zygosaccharomyces parabailii]|nr:STE14 (YDR410C) [Zygosaccharomyces parabailii]CDH11972.1 related to Protein-S-isoprenylcysteine O-methyltransferase [Zygosaccharomyces bailii ISA1307]